LKHSDFLHGTLGNRIAKRRLTVGTDYNLSIVPNGNDGGGFNFFPWKI